MKELIIDGNGLPLALSLATLAQCAQQLSITASELELTLAPNAVEGLPPVLQQAAPAVQGLGALAAAVSASPGVDQVAVSCNQLQLRLVDVPPWQLAAADGEQHEVVILSMQQVLRLARRCQPAAPALVVARGDCLAYLFRGCVPLVMTRRSSGIPIPLSLRARVWAGQCSRVMEGVCVVCVGLLGVALAVDVSMQFANRLRRKPANRLLPWVAF